MNVSELKLKNDLEKIRKSISSQIILYSLLIMIFFLAVYENRIIYMIAFATIGLILLFYLLKNARQLRTFALIIIWILILTSFILMALPFNIFHYLFIERLLKEPIGLENHITLDGFVKYFGYLSFFAIISQAIILVYYFKFKKQAFVKSVKGEDEDDDGELGTWDYFMIKITPKKILELFALLSIASIFEEIVFRYLMLNGGFLGVLGISILYVYFLFIYVDLKNRLKKKINTAIYLFFIFLISFLLVISFFAIINVLLALIILSSVIFGLIHYGNGGWSFVVNSTFAGFIFAFAFLEMGFIGGWLVHGFWNTVLVFQMVFPAYLYEKYTKDDKNLIFKIS